MRPHTVALVLLFAVSLLASSSLAAGFLGLQLDEQPISGPSGPRVLVVVAAVVPGGPAARAGLVAGDIIVGAQDRQLHRAEDLVQLVRARPPGSRIGLRVLRGSQVVDIGVTVAEAPPGSAASPGSAPVGEGGPPLLRGVPLPDEAGVSAALQRLTLTAHALVPPAGAIVVRYLPGWVPHPQPGGIAIKSPDGFSTFEIGFAELPGFTQAPDDVVQRVLLPLARREALDLRVVGARAIAAPFPAGEFLIAGSKQGRRFFSHLSLGIIHGRPPLPGVPAATLIHWVLLGAIPVDEPQPRLNVMVAMALSKSEVVAGGSTPPPVTLPTPGASSAPGGVGGSDAERRQRIVRECEYLAWKAERDEYIGQGGGWQTRATKDRVLNECLAGQGIR
jgi:hypothetical protein